MSSILSSYDPMYCASTFMLDLSVSPLAGVCTTISPEEGTIDISMAILDSVSIVCEVKKIQT